MSVGTVVCDEWGAMLITHYTFWTPVPPLDLAVGVLPFARTSHQFGIALTFEESFG